MKQLLKRALGLVYPPTMAKFHRIVTWIGVVVAAVAELVTWFGSLGLKPSEKIMTSLGILTMLAAGWKRMQPRVESAIDSLPIPAQDEVTKPETPASKKGS